MQILASGGSINCAQNGQRAARFSSFMMYGLRSSSSFFAPAPLFPALMAVPVALPLAAAVATILFWHFLHLIFLPARLSGTLLVLPHSGQESSKVAITSISATATTHHGQASACRTMNRSITPV